MFGNDKIFTTKNFRPSYALGMGDKTVILSFPLQVIEDTVKKLSNTGENKEKTDFFRHFDWFDNFTQSMKTKFNDVVHKETFYPGAKLIAEGSNNHKAYIIISGTVNLVCQKKAGTMFSNLAYKLDPAKAKRDAELIVRSRNNGSDKNIDNFSLLGNLVKNGYVSNTMRTI